MKIFLDCSDPDLIAYAAESGLVDGVTTNPSLMKKRGEDFQKQMVINFVDNKVTTVEGDFELSEDFNTPLDN